ncbi:MAG: hypothetical protein CM15mP45_18760 [Deltaproteobacteria bacterium]|nr:MAG: hypothetical protein CM15mP45_18760 [Deltaproteobacteria bacterium]
MNEHHYLPNDSLMDSSSFSPRLNIIYRAWISSHHFQNLTTSQSIHRFLVLVLVMDSLNPDSPVQSQIEYRTNNLLF